MNRYQLPKIDLHLHLDGSMLPETAWELARGRGIQLPADTLEGFRQFIVVTADCRSVNEYLERFAMPLMILQDKASIKRVTKELIGLLASQGLVYGEIRFAPQLHLDKGLTQRDAIDGVLEGRAEGLAENPSIQIGIICCAMCVGTEDINMAENLETVRLAKEYLGKGVVAVDLAGQEGIVPLSNFAPCFSWRRTCPFPLPATQGIAKGRIRCGMRWTLGRSALGMGIIFSVTRHCASGRLPRG